MVFRSTVQYFVQEPSTFFLQGSTSKTSKASGGNWQAASYGTALQLQILICQIDDERTEMMNSTNSLSNRDVRGLAAGSRLDHALVIVNHNTTQVQHNKFISQKQPDSTIVSLRRLSKAASLTFYPNSNKKS
jgi:hypothetical protein